MPHYIVEYREQDFGNDVYTISYTVDANSLHEAIGTAWGLMKEEVEPLGGTIDDLDGWKVPGLEETERWKLAHIIYRAVTLMSRSDFVSLNDKEPWYRAAGQIILRGK